MKTVYLYTGGIAKAHPIYKEYSRYAPEGFQFTPSPEEFFAFHSAQSAPSFAARLIRQWEPRVIGLVRTLRIPKTYHIALPNETALVHSGQYPLLNHIPWVMDFENAATLGWYDRRVIDAPLIKRWFQFVFSQSYCRGILAWTTAAKESLLRAFDCAPFADKIQVAHLTIVPQAYVDRQRRNGPVKLLFCSGNFYYKGGLGAVLATAELAKHYDVHLTVVSQTPSDVFKEFGNHPNITFHKSVSAKERHDLMRQADIFIHPGHSETYGFVMLEAFSFGLPVISTDGYSAPELVEDGVRGYVVKNYLSWFDGQFLPWVRTKFEHKEFFERLKSPPQEYIERLVNAAVKLVEDRSGRLAMGDRAYKSVTEGMFSPRARQEAMNGIYEKALL